MICDTSGFLQKALGELNLSRSSHYKKHTDRQTFNLFYIRIPVLEILSACRLNC